MTIYSMQARNRTTSFHIHAVKFTETETEYEFSLLLRNGHMVITTVIVDNSKITNITRERAISEAMPTMMFFHRHPIYASIRHWFNWTFRNQYAWRHL